MGKVLILTYDEDPHAKSVETHLRDISTKYITICTEHLSTTYDLSFSSDALEFRLRGPGFDISVDPSWNIWNRRVMDTNLSISNTDIKRALQEEGIKTWEGFLYTHQGNVVNDPRNNRNANNKIHQLLFARQLGSSIVVPDTLVTNNPDEALSFYEKHHGNVCFKLQKGIIVPREGEYYGVYTNKLAEDHLKHINLIKQAPHLFQQYYDKEYELRIIAIGQDVIGTAIHSQDSELSKIDYRKYDFSVPYEHIEIPRQVEEFCLSMMGEYELHFGAFDFIYSKDQEYVFLELNPNGQWLWLEELSGYKISKDLAHYLTTL